MGMAIKSKATIAKRILLSGTVAIVAKRTTKMNVSCSAREGALQQVSKTMHGTSSNPWIWLTIVCTTRLQTRSSFPGHIRFWNSGRCVIARTTRRFSRISLGSRTRSSSAFIWKTTLNKWTVLKLIRLFQSALRQGRRNQTSLAQALEVCPIMFYESQR